MRVTASVGVLELVWTLDVVVDEHLLGGDVVDGEGHDVDAVHGIKAFLFIFGVEVLGELGLETAWLAGAPRRGRTSRPRSVAPGVLGAVGARVPGPGIAGTVLLAVIQDKIDELEKQKQALHMTNVADTSRQNSLKLESTKNAYVVDI